MKCFITKVNINKEIHQSEIILFYQRGKRNVSEAEKFTFFKKNKKVAELLGQRAVPFLVF